MNGIERTRARVRLRARRLRCGMTGVGLAVAVAVAALAIACDVIAERDSARPDTPDLSAAATEAPAVELVLIGGEVGVARSGADTFEYPELGMQLEHGDVVRTHAGARVVLRFGDAAVVWLQDDSEVEIAEPLTHAAGLYYGVRLRRGSVAALSAVVEQRRLRVRAPQLSAVATGTSFLVGADAESSTVAVTAGSVAVFPSGVDLHKALARSRDPELYEAVQRLLDRSVELRSDDQLRIEAELLRETDGILENVVRGLEEYETQPPDEEEHRRRIALMEYSGERISSRMPAVERIYAGSRSVLDQLAAATPAGLARVTEPAELSEIRIETEPQDAEILLDEQPIGRRVFSSLFKEDETVRLRVRREGYAEELIEITPPHERSRVVRVSLEPIKPAYSEEEFLQAVRERDLRRVEHYLDTGGKVNAVTAQGYHALALALGLPEIGIDNLGEFDPDVELVETLLKAGVAVNLEFYRFGQQLSALHVPILAGLATGELDLELIELLLEHGANPDYVLETGTMRVTPVAMTLIVGIENGSVHLELLRMLLEHGADPNISGTYEGRVLSPVMIAVVLGSEYDYSNAKVIALLAEHGADLNGLVNLNGIIGSPLYFAEYYERDEIAEALRRHGARL